jgi:4-amino-4-deoxy-L-arabinose transferase-like glycosyltransferase
MTTASPDARSEGETLGWRRGGVIFAVALAFRFAYLGKVALDPAFFTPWLDARGYLQWAQAIAGGNFALPPVFFHAPAYPYFLAALLLLGHGSLVFVRVVQILLGGAIAVLGGMLGARLFGRNAGLAGGVLCAAAAPLVMFDLELLSEPLFVALCLVALLALERATRSPSTAGLFATGLAFGLAAIARPTALILVPVALAWCLVAARSARWRAPRIARGLTLMVLGIALPIAPVTLHNAIVGHDRVLISSQGGINFFLGNNPNSDGRTPLAFRATDAPAYTAAGVFTDNIMSSSRLAADRALGKRLEPSEVSRYWFGRGLAWIGSAPRTWAALTLRKARLLTMGFEAGDNQNYTWVFDDWAPFRFMPRWWWLFPLAVAGFAASGARRGRLFLGAFAAAYGLAVVAFLVTERLRTPLYPILCLAAGWFLVWALSAARHRAWRDLAARLVIVVAVLAWINWDPAGVSIPDRIASRVGRAAACERRGDAACAERLYLSALDLDPRSAKAREAYGDFLVRHDRLGEAHAYLTAPVGARPPSRAR